MAPFDESKILRELGKRYKLISFVIGLLGLALFAIGLYLELRESRLGFLTNIGVSIMVAAVFTLLIGYLQSRDYVSIVIAESLKTLELREAIAGAIRDEVGKPSIANAILESTKLQAKGSVELLLGLEKVYGANIELLQTALQRRQQVLVYAVGSDLNDPTAAQEHLWTIRNLLTLLVTSGVRVKRIQVVNAPINWLSGMLTLMLHGGNKLEMHLTYDAPFIPQIVLVKDHSMLLIPTETELSRPFGVLIRKTPESSDIFDMMEEYLEAKYQMAPVRDEDATSTIIRELSEERKQVLVRVLAQVYLRPIIGGDPSLVPHLEGWASTNADLSGQKLKKKLRASLEESETFPAIYLGIAAVLDELRTNKSIKHLERETISEILSQTDLKLFTEIFPMLVEKQTAIRGMVKAGKVDEALSEVENWTLRTPGLLRSTD